MRFYETLLWVVSWADRYWQIIARFVVCKLLRIHGWEIKSDRFERSILIGDGGHKNRRMDRGWIRTRTRRCWRCEKWTVEKRRAPIHSDWQNPERLFER